MKVRWIEIMKILSRLRKRPPVIAPNDCFHRLEVIEK